MTAADQQRAIDSDALYDRYGKPLEAEYWGQYVAISEDGRTVLAPTLLEAVQRATATFGPGSFTFKVGERAVGKWR